MDIKNVIELTGKALAQAMGSDYVYEDTSGILQTAEGDLVALDTHDLVDVGKAIQDSGSTDHFCNALISLLGDMYFESREYERELPSIFVQSWEWGGFAERARVDILDILQDPMWSLEDGKTYEDHKFYGISATAKIYEEMKPFMVAVSIARKQMRNAFENIRQMEKFISTIYVKVRSTINAILTIWGKQLVCSGIAYSVEGSENALHLITMYKAEVDATFSKTGLAALYDQNFLKYCAETIANYRDYLSLIGTSFNDGSIKTWTPTNEKKTILLSRFARRMRFGLDADTYHDDIVALGSYDSTPMWQGITADADDHTDFFDFDTLATIKLDADTSGKLGIGTSAVTCENVVGVIYDRFALGICGYEDDEEVTTSYTASANFWNNYYHVLSNMCLDTSYSIIALCLD